MLYRENVRVSVRSIDNLLIDYNLQKSDDDEWMTNEDWKSKIEMYCHQDFQKVNLYGYL